MKEKKITSFGQTAVMSCCTRGMGRMAYKVQEDKGQIWSTYWRSAMTPQAAYGKRRSDTWLHAQQIACYTRPQLLAVWKELNLNDFEPVSKPDLHVYFIQRLIGHHEHTCIPVPFAVRQNSLDSLWWSRRLPPNNL